MPGALLWSCKYQYRGMLVASHEALQVPTNNSRHIGNHVMETVLLCLAMVASCADEKQAS